MYRRDLRYALTQPCASTSHAFTVVQSDYGHRVRRCKLSFPCVLNDVYVSVNCIMANELIFSPEQRIFIMISIC